LVVPLALLTIGTAMAQPTAAPAPVAPATGNPARAVPLREVAQGLVEMCTDYAGKPEIPFSEDKVRKSFPEDKTNRLGIVLQEANHGYSVRATTTEGVMMGGILAGGSCMINPIQVNKTTFAYAFSAALDNASGYARDSRPPPPGSAPPGSAQAQIFWRGPNVMAHMLEVNPPVVRITRAPEQPLRTGGCIEPCQSSEARQQRPAP